MRRGALAALFTSTMSETKSAAAANVISSSNHLIRFLPAGHTLAVSIFLSHSLSLYLSLSIYLFRLIVMGIDF